MVFRSTEERLMIFVLSGYLIIIFITNACVSVSLFMEEYMDSLSW